MKSLIVIILFFVPLKIQADIKDDLPLSKTILMQKDFSQYNDDELRDYSKLILGRLKVDDFEVSITDINDLANLISGALSLEELNKRGKENEDDKLLRAEFYLYIFAQGKILKKTFPFLKGMKTLFKNGLENVVEETIEKMEIAGKRAFFNVDAEKEDTGPIFNLIDGIYSGEEFLCSEVNIYCCKMLIGKGDKKKDAVCGKLVRKDPSFKWEIIEFKNKINGEREIENLKGKEDIKSLLRLAKILFENGKTIETGKVYEKLLRKYENNPEVIEKTAIFFLITQNVNKWRDVIEKGKKINLESKKFIEQWTSGLWSFSRGEKEKWADEKKIAMEKLSKISPERALLLEYITDAQILLNADAEITEIEKLNEQYILNLKNNETAWKIFLTLNYIKGGIHRFESAAGRLPPKIKNRDEIKKFIAKIYLASAIRNMDKENLKISEGIFRKIKKSDEIDYYKIIIKWLNGGKNLSGDFIKISTLLNPFKNEEAQILHSIYLYLGEFDKNYINKARKLNISHWITKYYKAKYLYSKKDYVGAYEELEFILREGIRERYENKIHEFMAKIASDVGEKETEEDHLKKIKKQPEKPLENFITYGSLNLEIGYSTEKGLILDVYLNLPIANL